jgi:hypothetical protein
MEISPLCFFVNRVVSMVPILKPFSMRKSRRCSYQALGVSFRPYSCKAQNLVENKIIYHEIIKQRDKNIYNKCGENF